MAGWCYWSGAGRPSVLVFGALGWRHWFSLRPPVQQETPLAQTLRGSSFLLLQQKSNLTGAADIHKIPPVNIHCFRGLSHELRE